MPSVEGRSLSAAEKILREEGFSIHQPPLKVHREVEPGTVLLVWSGFAGGESWIPFEVRHCRPEGARWVVGGEFIYRTLSGSSEEE